MIKDLTQKVKTQLDFQTDKERKSLTAGNTNKSIMGGMTMMCTGDKEQIKRVEAKKACRNLTGDETGKVRLSSMCVWSGAGVVKGSRTQIPSFRSWNLFYRHTNIEGY